MIQDPSTPAPAGLDYRVLLRATLGPLVLWAGVVAAATWQGYPGIVCMTPMALLLSVWTGIYIARLSRSGPRRRVLEALLGGAALGLAQGLVFSFVQWRYFTPADTSAEDMQRNLNLSAGFLAAGPLVGGLLSTLLAAFTLWRHRPAEPRGAVTERQRS